MSRRSGWIFLRRPHHRNIRGKLTGWRTSFAAILGLVNGFILTMLMTMLRFPYNYASAIGLSFLYQFSSLLVQRKIVEESPSAVIGSGTSFRIICPVHSIVAGNRLFRKFLIASSLLTMSFSAAAFFTVAAMKQFNLIGIGHRYIYGSYDYRTDSQRCYYRLDCGFERDKVCIDYLRCKSSAFDYCRVMCSVCSMVLFVYCVPGY